MIDKRFNYNKKCYIILNEGERFCPKCDGKGKLRSSYLSPTTDRPIAHILMCDVCLGDGKIDWIEEVTGKKIKVLYT